MPQVISAPFNEEIGAIISQMCNKNISDFNRLVA